MTMIAGVRSRLIAITIIAAILSGLFMSMTLITSGGANTPMQSDWRSPAFQLSTPRSSIIPTYALTGNIAICALARHEVNIRSWLLHYRNIGVNAFYIHDCSAVPLARYAFTELAVDDVRYEHFDVPRYDFRAAVYDKCIDQYSYRHEWMAFLDADEFLVLSEIDAVRFLSNFESYGSLVVHMQEYNASYIRPSNEVFDAYSCDGSECRQTAVIANTKRIKGFQGGFQGGFEYETGYFAVDDSMAPVSNESNISRSSSWLFRTLPQQRSHNGRGFDDVKTLVILWGEPRGGELAWKSIHKHLLKPLNAHLATYFTDGYPRTILDDMARYKWVTHAHADWGVVFEEAAEICSQHQDWRKLFEIKDIFLGGVHGSGHRGSGGILLAFRWLVLQKILDLNLAEKYDYMVLSRADQLHICDHTPVSTCAYGVVTVPNGEDYGGYNDRHLMAESHTFVKALNITTELVCDTDRWYNTMRHTNRSDINSELAQKIVWDGVGLNVSRVQRTMFLAKRAMDTSSWSHGLEDAHTLPFNLLVKYRSELHQVLSECADSLTVVKELRNLETYDWTI